MLLFSCATYLIMATDVLTCVMATEPIMATGQTSNNSIITIDIGVNYGSSKYTYEEVDKILKESTKGYIKDNVHYNVEKYISISNSLTEMIHNLKLVKLIENLFCTIGVHPYNAKDIHDLDELNKLEVHMSNPKVVAIGECGLDYDRMFSPKQQQIAVFRKQIQIAKKYNKPLYLHCRGKTEHDDSFEDMVNILNDEQYFYGIVHCFTGNVKQATTFIEMGFYIGITGWIYDKRRNKELCEALQVIPIGRIMVETDAPWLSIDKSRKSMPLDTAFIAEKVALIKQVPYDDAVKIFYKNTYNLFKF